MRLGKIYCSSQVQNSSTIAVKSPAPSHFGAGPTSLAGAGRGVWESFCHPNPSLQMSSRHNVEHSEVSNTRFRADMQVQAKLITLGHCMVALLAYHLIHPRAGFSSRHRNEWLLETLLKNPSQVLKHEHGEAEDCRKALCLGDGDGSVLYRRTRFCLCLGHTLPSAPRSHWPTLPSHHISICTSLTAQK